MGVGECGGADADVSVGVVRCVCECDSWHGAVCMW